MKECAVITIPNIALENFLTFGEDRSYHSLYVAGRFRIIDFLIGNLERIGIDTFVIITNNEEISNHVMIAWKNIRFVVLVKNGEKLELKFSNFPVSKYEKLVSSESGEMYFDFLAFLEDNSGKVFWIVGYPVWFPIERYLDEIKSSSIKLLSSRVGSLQHYHTVVLSKRYYLEMYESVMSGMLASFFNKYREHNTLEVESFIFMPFFSLKEYFKMNLSILDWKLVTEFEGIFGKYPIRLNPSITGQAVIGRHGSFRNSLIGDGSFVDGNLENCIICPGVRIEKGTNVRNAIIYPGNWIGYDVEIANALIDESNLSLKFPNIGDGSIIGGKGLGAPNTKYPSVLNFDASVIGKNVVVPKKTQVSLNAYIPSNLDLSKLKVGKYVKSSTSF
jgi:hypothetical protein